VKDLTKAIEALIELETAKTKLEMAKIQNQAKQEVEEKPKQEEIDKEALKEELKEIPTGELVIYAIKKNLIKRGSFSEEDKD